MIKKLNNKRGVALVIALSFILIGTVLSTVILNTALGGEALERGEAVSYQILSLKMCLDGELEGTKFRYDRGEDQLSVSESKKKTRLMLPMIREGIRNAFSGKDSKKDFQIHSDFGCTFRGKSFYNGTTHELMIQISQVGENKVKKTLCYRPTRVLYQSRNRILNLSYGKGEFENWDEN